MSANYQLVALVLAGGNLCLAAGCTQPTAAETNVAAINEPSGTRLQRVATVTPQTKTLQVYTTQPGRIDAFESTPLYPRVSGYVAEVLVDIGDRVQKGETLVRISVPELQDELAQKEALLAQAEAEVRQAEAAQQAAEAAITSAEARVRQTEAGTGRVEGEFQRWQAEDRRIQELAEKGSVTQKLADETHNQFRAAEAAKLEIKAGIESAKADHKEAEANVAKAAADVVAAKARVQVARANLRHTQTMVSYTEIKAPYDGVVTMREIDTGHYVQPGNGSSTSPLLTVARMDKVRIFVDIPEMEAGMVSAGEQGDPVIVEVQSLGGRKFEGKVARTAWSLDPSNRSLATIVDLPNEEGLLRPGMYATVSILLDEQKDVVALPITAIMRDGDECYVCSVADGVVQQHPVQLGLRSGNEIEIVSGLSSDQAVVLQGASSLEPGQRVEVLPSKS